MCVCARVYRGVQIYLFIDGWIALWLDCFVAVLLMLMSLSHRYYESVYDNAAYLNASYPPDLTPEEQLEHVTDAALVRFPWQRPSNTP